MVEKRALHDLIKRLEGLKRDRYLDDLLGMARKLHSLNRKERATIDLGTNKYSLSKSFNLSYRDIPIYVPYEDIPLYIMNNLEGSVIEYLKWRMDYRI